MPVEATHCDADRDHFVRLYTSAAMRPVDAVEGGEVVLAQAPSGGRAASAVPAMPVRVRSSHLTVRFRRKAPLEGSSAAWGFQLRLAVVGVRSGAHDGGWICSLVGANRVTVKPLFEAYFSTMTQYLAAAVCKARDLSGRVALRSLCGVACSLSLPATSWPPEHSGRQ